MLAVFQHSIVLIHIIRTAMMEKFVAIISVLIHRAVSAVPVILMEIVDIRMNPAVVEVVGAVQTVMDILARSIQIALRINIAALDFVPGMIAMPP